MTHAITTAYRRIAVLDIGKTNAKLVIVEADTGAEIAVRKTRNKVLAIAPYPHFDIDALWAFTLEALASFASAPGFDAISITTHGAAAALLDADGELALPVLDYEYSYPAAIVEEYDRLRPPFSETFSPRQPMGLNLGAQLHFQKTAFQEAFSCVQTILTYPQYWAWRLTGAAANEVTSLGCHTDLWAPEHNRYSKLVDRLDIGGRMAPLHSAFDALGVLKLAIAVEIGVTDEVPVYCGIHDSNASLLPHLVKTKPPFAVVSTGTWVIAFGVGGDLAQLDPARDTLANVDAYGRPVPSARFMGGREFEILDRSIANAKPEEIEAALPEVLAKELMLLPNVVKGSGPFPTMEGVWINDGSVSSTERRAAVSLYLALMTQTCLQLVGARGPVIVEGPFAANSLYLKALSTLIGRHVISSAGATGTSQGAALLTGIALSDKAGKAIVSDVSALASYGARWREEIATRR
ncbi:FGGY-family carbohydrate kinase [Oryzifoliimicrobium ureilyticus]|uniref:FGGY-family carbohydrate kinase n=1 Tax=Oryzifoliimicrobium ureilyticus TaxID=3113724 RepID=UPI00307643CC